MIKVQYDFLLKYCQTCKLQGQNKVECRALHPELRKTEEYKHEGKDKEEKGFKDFATNNHGTMKWNPTNKRFKVEKETWRFLSDKASEIYLLTKQ